MFVGHRRGEIAAQDVGLIPMTSSMLSHFSCVLFPWLISRGSVDVLVLLADVTRAREAATAVDAAHAVAMLAAETSAQEAVAAWDNATFHVGDAEDQAALAEREALERVSIVEIENVVALASAYEDAEGLVRKISLLEDELAGERWAREVSERERQAQFKELTLLQT
jgi:hypothetical protein